MDKDKREEVCLECGITINGHSFNSWNHKFNYHVKKIHKMNISDYIIKHELKGVVPKCQCGCGNRVDWYKGTFRKYFSDHKNHVKFTDEQKESKRRETNSWQTFEYLLNKAELSHQKLEESYDAFLSHEKSLADIGRSFGLDKRTVKRYWAEAGLIKDKNVFDRMLRKSQGMWKYKIIQPRSDDLEHLESLWPEITSFFTDSKTKRTITEAIRIFDLKIGYNYLFDKIMEKFGIDFIKEYVHLCNQSKIEIEFYNILKFYFPHSIKKQFILDGKTYDYLLGNKIIIELDGCYWHNMPKNKENDIIKDKIAKDKGYILVRIQDTEVRNIDILTKIKELYEKIQTCKD